MRFNDQHLVIIETLDISEARAFIKFLDSEIIRHQQDIDQAEELKKAVEFQICILEDEIESKTP